MHISNLKVRNFRAIENLELSFNKGLNVLIGENNSGKTAIIDLLRLIFDKVNYPHEIYWKESDFRVGSTDEIKPIEFEIKFKINNKNEKYWFNDLHIVEIDENNNMQDFLEIQGKITLINSNNSKKIKREFWGGKDFENKIPWEVWNSLNFTYLSPLRDVNRDLRPTDNNLLSKLFLNIADLKDDDYKEKMASIIKENFDNDEWIELLNEGKDKIITHLKEMNFIDDFQDIDINFSTFEYGDIVKKLILQLPINLDDETNKINYFNLYQNGLGYNNLIYASTIFGDIIQRKEILKQDYNLLLIEEPEAHLHPQLESTFFRYLQKLDMNNEFQIIVSSHSPTITAKTKLDNVIVMKNINNTIYATSIKDTCLKNEDKIFLKKFLDVTKSQLFFSNGVILVEGITEALLLPIFAKMLGEEYDLEKNGIEVIVTGISFQRYSGLFNSDDPNKRLNFKCAVLTDDDGDKKGLSDSRLNNLNKLSKNNFKAFIGRNTFEWELFKNNLNSDIIPKIFDKVHPRIRNNLKSNGTKFTPEILVKKLKKTKSEFAYELSEFLEKNYKTTDFIIPEYIKEAIIFVVDNHDE
ncbi:ATP-dependent endonuclease [uncultured Methanobrevibacter sp.]|uniref:ATP-dependent nuclease n=1 Tax=uncultured Methanobrevibacter sp. TaxID=253161 RepID=UPI0025DEC548|nr:AAA family ATPase [uncultured Methanobrevibacter sp.]